MLYSKQLRIKGKLPLAVRNILTYIEKIFFAEFSDAVYTIQYTHLPLKVSVMLRYLRDGCDAIENNNAVAAPPHTVTER